MNRILITGTCTRDIIDGKSYFGGAAGGIALNLGKQNIPVGLLSVLGDDEFSNKYLEELQKYKVDTSLVENIEGSLPTLEVISKDNNESARTFNDHGVYPILEKLTPSATLLNMFSWLHVVNTPKKLADYISQNFSHDVSYCPGSLLVRNPDSLSLLLLDKTRFLFCNEEEYEILKTKVDVKSLFKNILEAILVTRGEYGVTVVAEKDQEAFPTVKTEVVDTTGAGDAFFVGFVEKRFVGMELREAVIAGMQRASQAIKRQGVIFT